MPSPDPAMRDTADRLADIVRGAYQRGWTLGTSGNFSAVVGTEPLQLLITPSGADKGTAAGDTHSVWSTLLSDASAPAGGLAIEGYEMLKGLRGVTTHAHREWLPIIENTQDWAAEAPRVESLLREQGHVHGLLIRRHGLYTWGSDLDELKRHLEVLEFLLEVVGRSRDGHGGQAWPS